MKDTAFNRLLQVQKHLNINQTQGIEKAQIQSTRPIVAFDSTRWLDLQLVQVKTVTSVIKKFVFQLPSSNHIAGLPTASSILARFETEEGESVVRTYTPISRPNERGFIEFIVKRYPKGLMSGHIFNLKIGESLSFKGPIMKYKYITNMHDEILLIGGGTGIAPIYQVLLEIFDNPEDVTKVTLIYGNVNEDDIILKPELDELASFYPDRFRVYYFLDRSTSAWKGKTGYITKEFISKVGFPNTRRGTKIFVCGPPPMYKAICGPKGEKEVTGALGALKFRSQQVFKF